MTNDEGMTPSDVVGERVREVRDRRRGLTREELAGRCAAYGAPALTASVISDIETGRRTKDGRRRRTVSVDELLALAAALNAPPVMLLTPDDGEAYSVTSSLTVSAFIARAWIRGAGPLGEDDDPREYQSLLPLNEYYTVMGDASAQQRFLGRRKDGDDGPR